MEEKERLIAEITSLKHKRSELKTVQDSLKLTNNSTYGKLGSKYSFLYSPNLVTQVTLTGQLCLLMLIEALELAGVPVVSANTDGIVTYFNESDEDVFARVAAWWCNACGLELEHTAYQAIYNRDVNSYIAVKPDGKVKTKGAFAYAGLSKNPANEICVDAVVNFLTDFTPPETTILNCEDIKKFVTIKRVTGGGVKDGEYLGKAVRWYYATGEEGTINYAKNGNIVGRSLGAKPLMLLPEVLPDDLDYSWYIREAYELLMDIGRFRRPPPPPKKPRKKKASVGAEN